MTEHPKHLPAATDAPALFARTGLAPARHKFLGNHVAFDADRRPTGGTVPCGCLTAALMYDRYGPAEGAARIADATTLAGVPHPADWRALGRDLGVRAGFVAGLIDGWDFPEPAAIGADVVPDDLEPCEHPSFAAGRSYALAAAAAVWGARR